MIYAGIGSRTAPEPVLSIIERIGERMGINGWILRSGGADGCDTAFYNGHRVFGKCEIFKAKDATPEAIELASKFHPAWHNCTDYVRRLHGRNAMIILGSDLK